MLTLYSGENWNDLFYKKDKINNYEKTNTVDDARTEQYLLLAYV